MTTAPQMTTELPAVPVAAATPALATVGEASSSPTIGVLAGALARAQGAMAHAQKDSLNPHFGKTYADLASVIDAAKVPLSENGIAIIQRNLECDGGVRVQSILAHESGEWISDGVLFMPVSEADRANPQRYGSALTYARRYAYSSLVGIAPEEDDANGASPATATSSPAAAAAKAKTLTWPFGDQKGTPLDKMPDNDLKYMISREIKEDRYKASNLEMRAACQAVLDERQGKPAETSEGRSTVTRSTMGEHQTLTEAAAEAATADEPAELGAVMDAQDAAAETTGITQGERRVLPHELIPLWEAADYDRAALQNSPECPLSAEVMLHLCAVMAAAGYASDKADAVDRANGVIAAQGAKLNSWAYGQMGKMLEAPRAGTPAANALEDSTPL